MKTSPLSRVLFALPLSFTVACAMEVGTPGTDDGAFDPSSDSGDTSTPPGGDGSGNGDGNGGGNGDGSGNGEQGACGIPSSMADLGALSGEGYKESENGSDFYEASVVVNAGPPEDLLWVGLFSGFGAFANSAPAPGSYSISGADATATDCGACIALDVNATQDSAERSLIATGGQLIIEQVDGTLSGRAENLVFQEIDMMTGQLLSGGCSTTISSVSFSAPLQQQQP